jgi:lantibiotic modifying enzyme
MSSTQDSNKSIFLDTATAIGARLCHDALWDGARCNWLHGCRERADQLFGPELYSGTSGIALFLGQLYRATQEKLFKTAAVGAALESTSRAGDIAPANRPGFYSGHTGIAYVLAELSELLDRDDLFETACALLEDQLSLELDRHMLDVFSGSAGSIPALLRFYRKYTREVFLQLAVRHGEHLVRTANRRDEGFSWTTVVRPGQPDLLGFSHGTAGIGWSLLELYQAVQDRRYRETARGAFRYERHHFSAPQENWPDLRDSEPIEPGRKAEPAYRVAWCHGAPGIGLSRLRCFQLTGDVDFRKDAEAAIRTTMRSLDAAGLHGEANFSLCHGLAGNAELLIYAAELIRRKDCVAAAEQVGLEGIRRYERSRRPWPCGALGGREAPNLLLGLAGIGYFYLRLHRANEFPSVLIVTSRLEPLAAAA